MAMKNGVQWAELAGHDYVLDLVSDLELLRDFPRQKSYFIVGAEGPLAGRGDAKGYVATFPDRPPPGQLPISCRERLHSGGGVVIMFDHLN